MPVAGPEPTVGVDDLRQLVGAGDDDTTNAVLERCLTFGQSLVSRYTQRITAGAIPQGVLDEATLAAAADQWNRRQAPNGILNQQYATTDGTTAIPIRVGRDPFASVRPMLRPWVGGGLRAIPLAGSLDAL